MPRRKTIDERVELNMTPMIDVTFQLLIFFIVTMKFRMLEKRLVMHLPTDFGGRNESREIDENFVALGLRQRADRPGLRPHEQRTVFLVEGEAVGVDELVAELSRLRRGLRDPIGKIQVGRGVPHGQVVRALDALRRAGFDRLVFAGLAGLRSGAEFESYGRQLRRDLAEVLR